MKKLLLWFIFSIFIITPVYAKDNRLYFTEDNNRLYYESSLLGEDVFMKHLDMVPGSSYTDELVIENATSTNYSLYFKAVPRNQSREADELLDNITMKIYLDGSLIYNGRAKGLDYNYSGVNLQDAILLGEFKPSRNSKMVFETHLLESYSNTRFNDSSYIDWSFYAQYGQKVWKVEPIPKTGILGSKFSIIPFVGLTIILIIGFFFFKKKRKA